MTGGDPLGAYDRSAEAAAAAFEAPGALDAPSTTENAAGDGTCVILGDGFRALLPCMCPPRIL